MLTHLGVAMVLHPLGSLPAKLQFTGHLADQFSATRTKVVTEKGTPLNTDKDIPPI
jgi:hypothetical protein